MLTTELGTNSAHNPTIDRSSGSALVSDFFFFLTHPRGSRNLEKLTRQTLDTKIHNLPTRCQIHFRTVFHNETQFSYAFHTSGGIFRSKNSLTDVLAKLGSQHTSPSWILVNQLVENVWTKCCWEAFALLRRRQTRKFSVSKNANAQTHARARHEALKKLVLTKLGLADVEVVRKFLGGHSNGSHLFI